MTPDQLARALKLEVGRCERCGETCGLETHEILRGIGLRQKARGKRFCSLVLCRDCHGKMGGASWESQLMILFLSRKEDFDLCKFWDVAGRRKPLPEELIEEAMHFGAENAIRRTQ